MKRSISLRTRLVAVFAGCLVPVLAAMAWMEAARHAAHRDGVRAQAAREAALLSNELARLVDGVEQLLQAVAVSPAARQQDPAQCDAYLEQLQLASHGSAALGIADASGRVSCLSRRVSAQQLDASERRYFREAVRTKAMAVGEFALGKAAGAKALHFGYPILDARGEVAGVAFAPLNLDWLAQQLADRRLPGHASLTVTDQRGTVLVRLPQRRMAGQPLPASWQGLLHAASGGTQELPGLAGDGREIVGYVPLGQGPQGLFVAVGLAVDEAMQPARAAFERSMLLAGGAILAAVVLSWGLSRRYVHRPLGRLLEVSAALRRGELQRRVDTARVGDKEFARMGEELNALAAALQVRAHASEREETDLRAARDRAEAASRSLSDLLAVAGHDLRQPVQSMVFSAALLGHKLQGRPEAPAALRLQRSARELVAMIDGLLSVSQLEAGRVEAAPRAIALHELLEGVAGEFAEQAVAAGIALHHAPTPLWTHTDPALLRRVLGNCVSNALKYTPAGGRVDLACTPVDDRTVALSVADTGIGIAPEQQAAVWEPFRQLDNPERDLGRGLGLGLAIVRRIADLLGHEVALQSQPGQGTTVTLRLPIVPAAARGPADAGGAPRLSGRLLLVEDDAAVAASTADLLATLGMQVVTCGSAEQAMGLLADPRARRFDVVLADHRLPAQSGLEVLRAARLRWPKVTAVLMSGALPPARLRECEAEHIGVLLKPFDEAALRHAIAPHHHDRPA